MSAAGVTGVSGTAGRRAVVRPGAGSTARRRSGTGSLRAGGSAVGRRRAGIASRGLPVLRPAGEGRYVLIDGYRRVSALRKLGREVLSGPFCVRRAGSVADSPW